MDETYLLQTKGLTKVYGEQTAVRAVNLHLRAGRLYGLLGRNGAGKTTIMKMALRLVLPTEGEIRLFGQRLTKRDPAVFHRIGAMIETPGFYPNLTGTENLAIFARLRGTTRPDAIAHALSVVGLPYRDKKLFSQYSLGMKQRLGIANAILHDPELLILDEPTGLTRSALLKCARCCAGSVSRKAKPSCFPAIFFQRLTSWPTTLASWTTAYCSKKIPWMRCGSKTGIIFR